MSSAEELFAVADGDYLVRTDVAPDAEGIAWAGEGAFAFGGSGEGPDLVDWLTVVGTPEAAADLLVQVLRDLPRPPHGVSVPRGTDLRDLELTEHENWDYMVWDIAGASADLPLPVQPGEERVSIMLPGPETDAEIEALLKEANPSHSTKPGWDGIELWAAIRDPDGGLLACGAFCRRDGGHAWLASIGTLPAARGQGLGAAVSAWMTRRAIEAGDEFCSLGHWAPNEPARRIYARLGYQTTHRMCSGRLSLSGDASP